MTSVNLISSSPKAPGRAATGAGPKITVDNDDIVPDIFDVAPFDDNVLLPAKDAEKTRPSIDDQGLYTGVGRIDFDIAYTSQPSPVVNIDDVFITQIVHPADHKATSDKCSCLPHMFMQEKGKNVADGSKAIGKAQYA